MSTAAALPVSVAPRPRERLRRSLTAIVVAGVILVVTFGGYVAAGALSTPVGDPVVVGDTVQVTPLSGWQVVGGIDNVDAPAVRLTRGTATLDTFAPLQSSGDPAELLRRYVRAGLEPSTSHLEVSEQIDLFDLPTGTAARASYAGNFEGSPNRIEGEVTAVIDPLGRGIVFDAWGPDDVFGYSVDDADRMIRSAQDV